MSLMGRKLFFNMAACSMLCLTSTHILASGDHEYSEKSGEKNSGVSPEFSDVAKKSSHSQSKSISQESDNVLSQEVFHKLPLEEFNNLTLNDLKLSCVQRFERIREVMEKDQKEKRRKTRLAGQIAGSAFLIPVFGTGFIVMGDVIGQYKNKKRIRENVLKSIREISDTFYSSQLIRDGFIGKLTEHEVNLFKRLYQLFIKKKVTEKITDSEVARIYYDGMESGFFCKDITLEVDFGRSGHYFGLYAGKNTNYVESFISDYYSKENHGKETLTKDIQEYQTRRDKALQHAASCQLENAVLNS